MYKSILLILCCVAASAVAQRLQKPRNPQTTPVPILRQINTHNDDGSYTYGYENGDGSYKVENKAANGEVSGKYGYYDDEGTLREIEYGASKNGFAPSGTDIQVPAPVISNNQFGNSEDYDDGQYRPGPGEKSYRGPAVQTAARPASRPASRPAARPASRRINSARNFNTPQAPAYQQEQYQQNYYEPAPEQNYQQQYQQQQQQYQQQQIQYQQQQQQQYQPVNVPAHIFAGHPARNLDLNTGSYTVQY